MSKPSTIFAVELPRRDVLRLASGGIAAIMLTAVARDAARARSSAPSGRVGQDSNHFVLEGEETSITYDATTDTGGPLLTYEGPYGSQTFDGETLVIEQSALGRMVTAYLGPFPDQGELWLTLLLPAFDPMTVADEPAPFATLAILKWLVSTIAGPPQEGALEEYRVLPLEGTAELVMS